MATHKHMGKLCCAALALALLLTLLFMGGKALGIKAADNAAEYETRLFDTDKVHSIHIIMDDWDSFISDCENEEYALCAAVIDGEAFRNVAIRAKGNTSLSSVSQSGSDRYSFKLEFDHYETGSYYGLDKLSLNNLIQDNTYMKDYLVYQMMGQFGVAAPLCSYAYITVNGEDWGLYLAVEGVEDAFLRRNYGTDAGELYKPDSTSNGGGRGNGRDFDISQMELPDTEETGLPSFDPSAMEGGSAPQGGGRENSPPGGMGGMGSSDVKLQYTDDTPESYSNIFDNAKTPVTQEDQTRLIASLQTLSSGGSVESVVDIEAVLRYFVVHNFSVNDDSYTGSMIHNYYLYEKDGQMSMIPWDYNLAFGTFQSGSATDAVNRSIDSPVSGGSAEDRPMLTWIFREERYAELYHQYFEEFLSQFFENDDLVRCIGDTAALIAPYVAQDPTKFCTEEEFEKGVSTLRRFCLLRAESIRCQLKEEDSTVDASSLELSAMGTMGGGRNQMSPQRPDNQASDPQGSATLPQMPTGQEQEAPPEMPTGQGQEAPPEMPEGQAPPGGQAAPGGQGMMPPGGSGEAPQPPGQGEFPSMPQGSFREDRFPQNGFEGSGDFSRPQEDTVQNSPTASQQSPAAPSWGTWLLLAASLLLLPLGILFALKFRRR